MFERIKNKFGSLSTERRRILTLDLLRGFFLFAIILNHSPLSPKLTDLVTGGGGLIVSAAEGFFIVSGLLVGYLYAHKILTATRTILKKIWKRALLLYIISITTTVVFTIIGNFIYDPTLSSHLYSGSIFNITFWQQLLSLTYVYGWADFLSRYAVFMFFAPIGLLLIAINKSHILALISILVWFISPALGLEQFTAWQLLFVFGMIAGSHLEEIIGVLKKPKYLPLLQLIVFLFLLSASLSLYVTLVYPFLRDAHLLPGIIQVSSDHLSDTYNFFISYFNKETLGFGRVIFSFIWFTGLFIIFWKYESSIKRYSYGLFEYLGKNTLTAYVIHSGVIFFLCSVFTTNTSYGMLYNTILAVIALAATVGITLLYNRVRPTSK